MTAMLPMLRKQKRLLTSNSPNQSREGVEVLEHSLMFANSLRLESTVRFRPRA